MAGFEDMYAKALAEAEAGIDDDEAKDKFSFNTEIPSPTQIPGIETIDIKPHHEKNDSRGIDRVHEAKDNTHDDSMDRRQLFKNIDDNMPNISELTFDFTDSGTVNSWKWRQPADIENYISSYTDDKNHEEYLKVQRPGPLPTLFSGRTTYFNNQYESSRDLIGARTIASDQTEKTNNTQANSDRSRAISQDSESGSVVLGKSTTTGNNRSNKPERRHSNRSENSNVVDYSEYQNEKKYDWNHVSISNVFSSDLDDESTGNHELYQNNACNTKEDSEKDPYILDWNHKEDRNKNNDKNINLESKSEISRHSETTVVGNNANQNDDYILSWNQKEEQDNEVESVESNNFKSANHEFQNKNINNELATQTNNAEVESRNDYILDWNHKNTSSAEKNSQNKSSFPSPQQSQNDTYILDWNHKKKLDGEGNKDNSARSKVERNESKNESIDSDKTSHARNSSENAKPQWHDGFVPLTTKQPKHQISSAINTLADSVSSSLSQKKKSRSDEVCSLNSASAHGAPFLNLDENLSSTKQKLPQFDSSESQSVRVTLKSKDSLIFSLSDSDPSTKINNITGQQNSAVIPTTILDPFADLSFDNTNETMDNSSDDPFLGLLHQSIKDSEKDDNDIAFIEDGEKGENDENAVNNLSHHMKHVRSPSLNFHDILEPATDFSNLEKKSTETEMNTPEENIKVDHSQSHSPEILQSETLPNEKPNSLHIPSLDSPERIRTNVVSDCSLKTGESEKINDKTSICDSNSNLNDDIENIDCDESVQSISQSNNLDEIRNSPEEDESKESSSHENSKTKKLPDWADLVFLDDIFKIERQMSAEQSSDDKIDSSPQDAVSEVQGESHSTTSSSSMHEITSSNESGSEIEANKHDLTLNEEGKKHFDDVQKSQSSDSSVSTGIISDHSNVDKGREKSGWEAYVFLDNTEFNINNSIDEDISSEEKNKISPEDDTHLLKSSSGASSYNDSISSENDQNDQKNIREEILLNKENISNGEYQKEQQECSFPPSLDASADKIPKMEKEKSEVINMFNLKNFDDYENKPLSRSKESTADDSDSEESDDSKITEVYRQESNRFSFGVGHQKESAVINEGQSESSGLIEERHSDNIYKEKEVESQEGHSVEEGIENKEGIWMDERKPEPELEKLISDFNSVTSNSIAFSLPMVSSTNSTTQMSVDNTTTIDDDNTIASCAGTVLEKLITDFNSVTKDSLPRELADITPFRSSSQDQYNDMESRVTCNSIEEEPQEELQNLISRFNDPDSYHTDTDKKSENTDDDKSCNSKTNCLDEGPTLKVEKLRGADRRKVFEEQRRKMHELYHGAKEKAEKIEATTSVPSESEACNHDTDKNKEVMHNEMNTQKLSSSRKNDAIYNEDVTGEYDKVDSDENKFQSFDTVSSLDKQSCDQIPKTTKSNDTKNTMEMNIQRKRKSDPEIDELLPSNQAPEIMKKTSPPTKVSSKRNQHNKEDSHPLLNTIHEDKSSSANGDLNGILKKSDSEPTKKKMSKMKKVLLLLVFIVMITVGICLGLLIPLKRPPEKNVEDERFNFTVPTPTPTPTLTLTQHPTINKDIILKPPILSTSPLASPSLPPYSDNDAEADDWLFTDDSEENTPSPTASQSSLVSNMPLMNDTTSSVPTTSQNPSISGFPSVSPSVSYLPSSPSVSPFPSISFAPVYNLSKSSTPSISKAPTTKNIPFMNIMPSPTFNNVSISHKVVINTTDTESHSMRHRVHKENVTSQ